MDLSLENVKKLMRFRPSLKETANLFNISEDTIERRIREWENCTFKEFKERHAFGIKHKLIDRAYDLAMAGNSTMMIFCLKNMAGWKDQPDTKIENHPSVIPLAYVPLQQRKESNEK